MELKKLFQKTKNPPSSPLLQKMIKHLELLDSKSAFEIMTPKTQIVFFPLGDKITTILEQIKEEGYSRYLVCTEELDSIVGILHVKNLLSYLFAAFQKELNIKDLHLEESILQEVFFIPESKKLDTLLQEMLSRKIQLAVVLDFHGNISGLISLEDIIESFVGDIEDEFDASSHNSKPIQKISNHLFHIYGEMLISKVEEVLKIKISPPNNITTISGLFYDKAEKRPFVGQKFTKNYIIYEILEMEHQYIKLVSVDISKA